MTTLEINKYWKYLEKKYKAPKYISKVKIIDFKFLKKKIDNKDIKFIKSIIKSLYVDKIGVLEH